MLRLWLVAMWGLLWGIQGDWTGPRAYYNSGTHISKVFTHINTDTGYAHNFAIVGQNLTHRAFKAGFSVTHALTTSHRVYYIEGTHTKHTAAKDGGELQYIVVVFEASRSGKDTTTCTRAVTEGCAEVYISESKDEGNTWSAPITISRSDKNDVVHRRRPSVTYDRDSDMIYIVYEINNQTSGESVIGITKRLVNDRSYKAEAVLKIPMSSMKQTGPKLAVTIPKRGVTNLHLVYLGMISGVQSLYYTVSSDKGETWKAPVDLTPQQHGYHNTMLTSVGICGEEVLFLLWTTSDSNVNLFWSEEGGRSWKLISKLNVQPGLFPTARACGQTRTLGLFATLFTEQKEPEYLYFNRTSGKIEQLSRPFKGVPTISKFPMIDCTGLIDTDMKLVATTAYEGTAIFDDFGFDYPAVSR